MKDNEMRSIWRVVIQSQTNEQSVGHFEFDDINAKWDQTSMRTTFGRGIWASEHNMNGQRKKIEGERESKKQQKAKCLKVSVNQIENDGQNEQSVSMAPHQTMFWMYEEWCTKTSKKIGEWEKREKKS